MSSILDLPARHILAAFRSRELSPVDYTHALIARVEASEPSVQALWLFRPERALDEARLSEQRYRRDEPLGLLDGMPVTVKELIATRGDHVPMGTAALPHSPAAEDAPPAARLREDGAIIFAKTTCPDFGMLSSGLSSFHHLSRNPWDIRKNPGGSSSGAAAAGAAGYGPLHLGTDIGGSVRLPAGWTGLFGFKPSLGRVPIDPYYTGRVAGPMTPTVDDAALMMQTISRPDWRDATSLPPERIDWDARALDVQGLRLGLMMDAGCGISPDPEVAAAIMAAVALFQQNGATVLPIGPVLTRDMLDGLDIAWRARFWGQMQKLSADAQDRILPYIREWAKAGAAVSSIAVAEGFEQTFAMRRATNEALHGLDFILSPVNPQQSYPADWASPTNDPARPFEHIAFTVPWNMGEQPAASIHCGLTSSGIPIGLQIVGHRFDDLGVMRLSRAYEEWRGPVTNWPRYDTYAANKVSA
ncbi:amidase [Paracoccus aestuariivivens]|uniref:Amidase n=1 Tax=Paracoccus aestuariivivens TaxID=1820333 RepID=A0A6L6JDD2_9RHOB|nr:amidase [Paracoccus aestuariivivens]MTH80193.1 amidase [Paracoccus aestuariivivens]